MRISSCKQAGSGGATSACVIELGKPQSVLGETIKVGSFNLTPVTTNIGPAHIVCHDKDYIRPALAKAKNWNEKKKIK